MRDPILETARARRRHPVRLAASLTVTAALGLILADAAYAGLAAATGHAPSAGDLTVLGGIALGVILAYGAIWYLIHRHHTVYAGARWVGDSTSRDHALTTHDLARIHLTETTDGWELRLTGADTTTLQIPLGLLEGNPRLWDLLHHGLRHSAAAGATTDPRTRELLRLPAPAPPP